MEIKNYHVEKLCGFYVSDWHLATTVLPYINSKIEENTKVITFLENNIEKNIQILMQKLNLKNKNDILKIRWKNIIDKKYQKGAFIMEKQIFTNEVILSWLQYYAKNTTIDLAHVKIIDITKKNKNVIPTVESHKTTMVFTNAGIDDIFYRLWNAGLGECEVWYNDGSEPDGPILNSQVKDMINRGINASAGMLIVNPNARNTAKIGIGNEFFKKGSIQYVGSEIRAVILNKMMVDTQDDVCVIGGESIAIETALLAPEGTVIAVEYSATDRDTMEENVDHFGLQNVKIIDHVDEETMRDCPVPSTVFMVASASMNQELEYFVKKNPNVHVVIYTLDFQVAAGAGEMLSKLGIQDVETIQIAVSRLSANHSFKQQPAPWIITGRGE